MLTRDGGSPQDVCHEPRQPHLKVILRQEDCQKIDIERSPKCPGNLALHSVLAKKSSAKSLPCIVNSAVEE